MRTRGRRAAEKSAGAQGGEDILDFSSGKGWDSKIYIYGPYMANIMVKFGNFW